MCSVLQRHWMTLGSAAVAATLGASMMFTLTPAGAAPATADSSAAVQVAAAKAKTKLKGWSTKAATVRLEGALGATVTVAPKAKRQVAVEYRKRGTTRWLTQSKVTSSSAGSAYVSFAPPSKESWEVRLVVPATRSAAKLVTKPRVVKVKGTAGAPNS
jgi:hypothetical protein